MQAVCFLSEIIALMIKNPFFNSNVRTFSMIQIASLKKNNFLQSCFSMEIAYAAVHTGCFPIPLNSAD